MYPCNRASVGILTSVLLLASIVLLESVCAVDNVAIEELTLIVFANVPSKLVPLFSCKPLPTINGLIDPADVATVIEPPSATAVPLIVMELFASMEFLIELDGMLRNPSASAVIIVPP